MSEPATPLTPDAAAAAWADLAADHLPGWEAVNVEDDHVHWATFRLVHRATGAAVGVEGVNPRHASRAGCTSGPLGCHLDGLRIRVSPYAYLPPATEGGRDRCMDTSLVRPPDAVTVAADRDIAAAAADVNRRLLVVWADRYPRLVRRLTELADADAARTATVAATAARLLAACGDGRAELHLPQTESFSSAKVCWRAEGSRRGVELTVEGDGAVQLTVTWLHAGDAYDVIRLVTNGLTTVDYLCPP